MAAGGQTWFIGSMPEGPGGLAIEVVRGEGEVAGADGHTAFVLGHAHWLKLHPR